MHLIWNYQSLVWGVSYLLIISIYYYFLIFVFSLNRELASEVSPFKRLRRYITSSFWLDYFGCFGFNLVILNFQAKKHFSFQYRYEYAQLYFPTTFKNGEFFGIFFVYWGNAPPSLKISKKFKEIKHQYCPLKTFFT